MTFIELQAEYDKVFNENRELRAANKALFEELEKAKEVIVELRRERRD